MVPCRGSRWFCCQFLSLGDRKVTYSDADTLSKTTRDTATLATCDRIFNVGLIGKCTFLAKEPNISGSGIPQVEGQLAGLLESEMVVSSMAKMDRWGLGDRFRFVFRT